ncbi:hypothetical protein EJB05_43967, partial [Eragrostis curvula]
MSRKTKPPAPAVASTGCSSLMSCLSLHRRGPPQPTVHDDANCSGDAEQYWKRVRFLEEEIRRLSKWLGQEERPATAAGCVVGGGAKAGEKGGGAAAMCVRNGAKATEEADAAATERVVKRSAKVKEESGSTGTTAAACTKRCVSVGLAGGGVPGMMVKLEDGSYLYEVSRVGRPRERLAVQVSRPVIPENAKSASEVLDKMTAMRADDLCKFLMKMMPLKDIAGRQNPGEPVRRPARLSSGDDLVDAIIVKAMGMMEGLIQEGLKIQMASTATDIAVAADERQRHEPVSKNCMVHVVLIQARDPKEWYRAIGDPMIGVIEASLERKDGKVKLEMQGMHVAGISSVKRKSSDGRCILWSASLRQCKGPHHGGGGGGCRCYCVRNPDRVFQR